MNPLGKEGTQHGCCVEQTARRPPPHRLRRIHAEADHGLGNTATTTLPERALLVVSVIVRVC